MTKKVGATACLSTTARWQQNIRDLALQCFTYEADSGARFRKMHNPIPKNKLLPGESLDHPGPCMEQPKGANMRACVK